MNGKEGKKKCGEGNKRRKWSGRMVIEETLGERKADMKR